MEIPISRDIRKFKTKDIGNFNFKEVGFIVAGVGAAVLTYKLTKSVEIAVLPLMIIIVFGFFKPYGMTFMQFLRTVGKERLSTQCYINETNFEYNPEDFKKLYGDDIYIPENWNDEIIPEKVTKEEKERILLV